MHYVLESIDPPLAESEQLNDKVLFHSHLEQQQNHMFQNLNWRSLDYSFLAGGVK